jgi:hypothetical protein
MPRNVRRRKGLLIPFSSLIDRNWKFERDGSFSDAL